VKKQLLIILRKMKSQVVLGAAPYFGETIDEITAEIKLALEKGSLTQGEWLKRFETSFAQFCGTDFAIGVNSGGTALTLALKAIDVKGKEVIVPTNTFVATGAAVVEAGGIPIFADTSYESLALSLASIQSKVTERTVAIIHVHMFGIISPELEEISNFCKRNNLFLIEDAAHAHGAENGTKKAGNIGDIACFSFYATKIITTGEGGIITTNNQQLYETILRLRNHGKSLQGDLFVDISNNYRLAEIPSILGFFQVKYLKTNVEKRRELASIYYNELKENPNFYIPESMDLQNHSFWRFPILLNTELIDRKFIQQDFSEKHNVRLTWMYEPLCHHQPLFSNYVNPEISLPISEDIMGRLICLPIHGGVSQENVLRICKELNDYFSS
jgi:perosamine synthetase